MHFSWLGLLGRGGCGVERESTLDPADGEDDVLVHLLVHAELACLAERTIATFIVAFKWFLLRVNVSVLFQVLC